MKQDREVAKKIGTEEDGAGIDITERGGRVEKYDSREEGLKEMRC